MPDQIDYTRLMSLSIFRDLDKNELEIVSKHAFEKSIKKDSILFMEGMPGELLYIIMSCSVAIVKKTKDNKESLLATMGANAIIGEMSLIDSAPRTATCRTSEDSVLLVITKKAFNEILDSNPRIAAKILMSLLKIMSNRLRITTDKKMNE